MKPFFVFREFTEISDSAVDNGELTDCSADCFCLSVVLLRQHGSKSGHSGSTTTKASYESEHNWYGVHSPIFPLSMHCGF